ncbi:5'-3' exonuclease [Povalibacter uvarum]|uniref:5'-3' exonuclease n=1 Tax=Povalibacter uvarum TaxID=732238 RepID=A0A841HK33_9GAMM|nr:5'-3' exonuclease H3TH domain-containing protein [Povalibacter uvarum]MBB6093407.1 5'-3' exonuclease [Povalibacter uvarum]
MLYLIDAPIFVFRAWHTVPNDVVDYDGNPVNALHGFARFLGDLIEREKPGHIAVAFDERTENSYRTLLYPAYKANRDPTPVELKRQFLLCRQLCRAMGVPSFTSNEYEADDIIGTLAERARADGRNVVIVTRDKDLSQLVRRGDVYWDYLDDRRYRYDDIAERFGVQPERMACFLALMGDAVDNIPGVPGVGRKTASMLFKHFESLPQLYDNLDAVLKLKMRNAGFVCGQLRDYRESAFLARKLTGIACDMPLEVQLSDLWRRQPNLTALGRLYDSVGFGRLLRNQAERIVAMRPTPAAIPA